MDDLYHYGGFVYHLDGTIDEKGVYTSAHDDEDILDPIARVDKLGFTLWVYPYAIVGLTDNKGNQKIARFDWWRQAYCFYFGFAVYLEQFGL